MKYQKKMLSILFLFMSASLYAESGLTEKSINAMLNDMRDAISRQDADGVGFLFCR